MNRITLSAAGVIALVAAAAGVRAQIAGEGGPNESSSSVLEGKRIDLAAAFPDTPAAAGREFRARKIEIAPGARTPEESGDDRPSIAYVTQGRVLEHRSDASAPIARTVADASGLAKGATRWWENASEGSAIVLIVDIASVPE